MDQSPALKCLMAYNPLQGCFLALCIEQFLRKFSVPSLDEFMTSDIFLVSNDGIKVLHTVPPDFNLIKEISKVGCLIVQIFPLYLTFCSSDLQVKLRIVV